MFPRVRADPLFLCIISSVCLGTMVTLSNFFSPEGERTAVVVYDREGFEVLCTESLEKTLEKKVFDREMDANDYAENWVLRK